MLVVLDSNVLLSALISRMARHIESTKPGVSVSLNL